MAWFMVVVLAARVPVLSRWWRPTAIGGCKVATVRRRGLRGGGSGCSCDPPGSCGAASDTEDGEAGEVVGGGEQVEVGVYLSASSYPCSPAAVAASHQMSQPTFDLGSGLAVIIQPGRVLGVSARLGQARFVAADLDGPSPIGGGALRAQRAGRARLSKQAMPSPDSLRRTGTSSPAGQVTVSAPRSM